MSIQAAQLPWRGVRDGVRELDALGYGALWVPEGGFLKEIFANSAILLAATERLPVVTAIANVWARDPSAMTAGANTVSEAFPGRFGLSLGVGHVEEVEGARGLRYGRPVEVMRRYVEAMDAAPYGAPIPSERPPRLIAAFGPRMLALAAAVSAGTNPTFVPVAHTRYARSILGPGRLLCPGLPLVLTRSRDRALRVGREYTRAYLRWANYRAHLRRLGWDDADFAGGGSDALVEAIVAWGDPGRIRDRAEEHFAAGADHVCLRPLPQSAPEIPVGVFKQLAAVLLPP
jgi:probable F420-dependent oxidoreductase